MLGVIKFYSNIFLAIKSLLQYIEFLMLQWSISTNHCKTFAADVQNCGKVIVAWSQEYDTRSM